MQQRPIGILPLLYRMWARARYAPLAAKGLVPPEDYERGGVKGRGAVEADVMKFFLNATNNKMTGVDSFLSEDKGCGFADGLCEDTEYGRYNDLVVVDTDRRADISSIDFIKHHR